MQTAIALTLTYLAVNLALMVWSERARADDHRLPAAFIAIAALLRYGPPLAGAIYLVAVSGDWVFVGFVLVFFLGAAWLMKDALAFTNHGPDGRRDTRRDDY
jgi:hypothetical protein